MREEKVLVPTGAIQLEGLLGIPEAFPFKGSVIFCHPHPQYGGDMHNPVITAGVEAAFEEGFSTLRFNFRGIGASGGSYGEGIDEREKVQAAVDYFCSNLKDPDPPLMLLGYSFGAWAGLPVAVRDRRIKAMVGVSPPLEIYDFEFLRGCKKKKLILAGNRDLYCPIPRLEEWYQRLEEPKSLTIIQGADHFFSSHHSMLIQPLKEFFKSI